MTLRSRSRFYRFNARLTWPVFSEVVDQGEVIQRTFALPQIKPTGKHFHIFSNSHGQFPLEHDPLYEVVEPLTETVWTWYHPAVREEVEIEPDHWLKEINEYLWVSLYSSAVLKRVKAEWVNNIPDPDYDVNDPTTWPQNRPPKYLVTVETHDPIQQTSSTVSAVQPTPYTFSGDGVLIEVISGILPTAGGDILAGQQRFNRYASFTVDEEFEVLFRGHYLYSYAEHLDIPTPDAEQVSGGGFYPPGWPDLELSLTPVYQESL